MPTRKSVPATSHIPRIVSLNVTGGFLDALDMEFAPGLNCIIGARGTGKTTALEFVRYVLRLSENREDKRSFDSLIERNLGGGRLRMKIETGDGLHYMVSRMFGEDPIVMDARQQPTNITLVSGSFFPASIYSQNEVERIADAPDGQLALIDRFDPEPIGELERKVLRTREALRNNARACFELEKALAGLRDELGTLDGIEAKLSELAAPQTKDGRILEKAHQAKSMRAQELRVVSGVEALFQAYTESMDQDLKTLSAAVDSLGKTDLAESQNQDLLTRFQKDTCRRGRNIADQLTTVLGQVEMALLAVRETKSQLSEAHQKQELDFQNLIAEHKESQGLSHERLSWERKKAGLLDKQKLFAEKEAQLKELRTQRRTLLKELVADSRTRSDLRSAIVEQINSQVKPTVRVRLGQCGESREYSKILANGLKGAGLQHGQVAAKLASTIAPTDLVTAVREENERFLVERGEINLAQAKKLISALTGSLLLYELESAELQDKPSIELLDGNDYKPTEVLSKGQKCTSILPLLFLDSAAPLLIDQPEDNLDNRFIFQTVVKRLHEVKAKRQCILVTHNANVPVLAEADRVFVLRSTGSQASVHASGTVDECKQSIVDLLEGGEEAFRMRKERYNY